MPKLKTEHLNELKFLSKPVLSPDAKTALAVHTEIKESEDVPYYESNVFLYDLANGTQRQLTRSLSCSEPQFSPDGSALAYLCRKAKTDKPQIYLLPLAGGEAEALTSFEAGVNSFCWQPNGKGIAFVSLGDYKTPEAPAREINKLTYRFNGAGWLPDVPAQLYLLNLKTRKSTQLSKLSVTGAASLSFTKDGSSLFFSAADETADDWKRTLYTLNIKSKRITKLLKKAGSVSAPSVSPDGETIVFFAPSRWDVFASPTGLYQVSTKGGEPKLLTGELDASPSLGGDSRYGSYPNTAQWLDNANVLINVNQAGQSSLNKLAITSKTLEPVVDEGNAITSFALRGETIIFTAETPQTPGELFLSAEGGIKQLSKLNAGFVKRFALTKASEAVTIKTKDKQASLTYWTLQPTNARKDKAMVVQVHGGPHTNYGQGFYHEFHMMAAAGYTVVYGNPRGGSSFGDDFATTILGRYGTIDADDVMSITRHAKRNHSDSKAPVHLTGGSYGGFMTNWLVGQTNTFRSAVTQRSICNWLSFYGMSDIGSWFTPIEINGNPWDNTDLLWEQSPLKHVAKVKTPTLIIHAEDDFRCPIGEAEQFYTALKTLGKADTKFIRVAGENHELSRSGRPDRRIARLNALIGWFETHA